MLKRGKGRVTVNVFIHFVPATVAGVPNAQQVTVTLIKKGRRQKQQEEVTPRPGSPALQIAAFWASEKAGRAVPAATLSLRADLLPGPFDLQRLRHLHKT